MKFARRLASAAAAAMLATMPALAQEAPAFSFGGWYLGATAGPTIVHAPGPSIVWTNAGFMAGYNWSPQAGLVLGFEVEGGPIMPPGGVMLCCDAAGSVRIGYVFEERFLAYAKAGVGSTLTTAGAGWWHVGGGLEVAFADRLAVFGEARAKWPFSAPGGQPYLEIRAGLVWHAGPAAAAGGTTPAPGMGGFYFGTYAGAVTYQAADSPYSGAGIQAGYNFIRAGSSVLVGFEVDIGPAFGGFLAPGTAWCCEGTISGRVGVAASRNLLLYGEMGIAGRVLFGGAPAYAIGLGAEVGFGGNLGLFVEWHGLRAGGGAPAPGQNEFRVGMNVHRPEA